MNRTSHGYIYVRDIRINFSSQIFLISDIYGRVLLPRFPKSNRPRQLSINIPPSSSEEDRETRLIYRKFVVSIKTAHRRENDVCHPSSTMTRAEFFASFVPVIRIVNTYLTVYLETLRCRFKSNISLLAAIGADSFAISSTSRVSTIID